MTAFGCLLIVLASSCAPITTTVRHDRQVLSSRSEERRSSDWSYAAMSRPIDAEANIARAEVEVTRARTCSLWTTRTVREVTVNDREYTTLVWPVIEWLVGVGGTVGAAILFAIEPAGGRDPMTDEFRLTPTGIGGTLAAVWGATGLTLGVVDLVRVVDDTHEDEPRAEEEQSAPEVCDREASPATSIEVVDADGLVLSTSVTDTAGIARVGVSDDVLLARGASLRLRVGDRDLGAVHGLDLRYAELRRAAETRAREAAAREEEARAARASAERARLDAIARDPRQSDPDEWDRWAYERFATDPRPAPRHGRVAVAWCLATRAARGEIGLLPYLDCLGATAGSTWLDGLNDALGDRGIAGALERLPATAVEACIDAMLSAPRARLRQGEALERYCMPIIERAAR